MIAKNSPAVLLCLAYAFLACAFFVRAEDAQQPGFKTADSHPGFAQFKRLEGEWVGKATGCCASKDEVRVKYKLTAGGSALVETIAPGSDHEMVTLIHPDGADLLLTHYCMLGNQPHMRASVKDDAPTVAFKFTHATNLKSEKAMHMHDATYTFVDNDTLRSEWTQYRDGKNIGVTIIDLKRKK